jgi:hypothetical protein
MTVIAVASVLDEAGIIHQTITHLLGQHVDRVIVSEGHSSDATRNILWNLAADTNGKVVRLDQEGPFDQAIEMTKLSRMAAEQGATWVIPFDADEFVCSPTGDIPADLAGVPESVDRCYMPVWNHLTWTRREREPRPMPKVLFRADPTVTLEWGQHDASGDGERQLGPLAIRELQYRDWDHFLAKIEKARRLYDSYDFPESYGTHLRRLCGMNRPQLEVEWERLRSFGAVDDPIPWKGWP